jgi:hypothetical protein
MLTNVTGLPAGSRSLPQNRQSLKVLLTYSSKAGGEPPARIGENPAIVLPGGRLAAFLWCHAPLTHPSQLCHFHDTFFCLKMSPSPPYGGLRVVNLLKKIPYAVLIPLTVLRNG